MIDASDLKKQDAMPILCDVVIPLCTRSRANERVHWRRRSALDKAEREAVCAALSRSPLETVGRVLVQGGRSRTVRSLKARPEALQAVLTRYAPSAGLDDDNLRSAFKAIRDELAAWLGVDDRDPCVTWTYTQERKGRGLYGVRLTVLDTTVQVATVAEQGVT